MKPWNGYRGLSPVFLYPLLGLPVVFLYRNTLDCLDIMIWLWYYTGIARER